MRSEATASTSSPARWPTRVVDLLEVVEVDDDQRQGAVVAAGTGDLALERLMEETPVVHAGERVEIGQLARLAEPARVLDRRRGALRQLLEAVQLVRAEPVTAFVAVDGQEAEPPDAVGERHPQTVMDPRLVVVAAGRRLGGRFVVGIAKRELDRTVFLAPAPAGHVERQLDRLGRQTGGGQDRRPVLRLERDQGRVGSGQPPGGFERALEHLVEIDRFGDLVEEGPPAPLLLGLPGRVGEIARKLVEARLEARRERRDTLAFAPPGTSPDAHDGQGEQHHADTRGDGDDRQHGLAHDQPGQDQRADHHLARKHGLTARAARQR